MRPKCSRQRRLLSSRPTGMSSLRSSRSEALLACFYSAVLKAVSLRTGNQSAVFNCSSHDDDHVQRHHRKQERCDNYGPEHPSTPINLNIAVETHSYPENSSARISSSEIPEPMSIWRTPETISGGPAM